MDNDPGAPDPRTFADMADAPVDEQDEAFGSDNDASTQDASSRQGEGQMDAPIDPPDNAANMGPRQSESEPPMVPPSQEAEAATGQAGPDNTDVTDRLERLESAMARLEQMVGGMQEQMRPASNDNQAVRDDPSQDAMSRDAEIMEMLRTIESGQQKLIQMQPNDLKDDSRGIFI